MNKSYKTVWNETTGTYVAASETAKSRGKKSRSKKVLVAALMAAGVGFGTSVKSEAAATPNSFAAGILGTDSSNSDCISSADGAVVTTNGDCSAATQLAGIVSYNTSGTAGSYFTVTDPNTAHIGAGGVDLMKITNSGLFMLNTLNMGGNKISNVAAGEVSGSSTDAVNGAQLFGITNGSAVVNFAYMNVKGNNDGTDNARLGANTYRSLAIGSGAVASDLVNGANAYNIVAIGTSATATGTGSTALGSSAVAGNSITTGATAVGYNASATAANSIALGQNSVANVANTVSVGKAGGERKIVNVAAGTQGTDAVNYAQLQALGLKTDSSGNATNSFVAYDDTTLSKVTLGGASGTTLTNVAAGALSASSKDAVNGSQLFATNTNVSNLQATIDNLAAADKPDPRISFSAISGSSGYGQYTGSPAAASGQDSIAIGGGSLASTGAVAVRALSGAGSNALAFGYGAQALGNSAIAFGFQTQASGGSSVAVGNMAVASEPNAMALGRFASATAAQSVALGMSSIADQDNTISVGRVNGERKIVNVAAGTNATDAVNYGQLQSQLQPYVQHMAFSNNSNGSLNGRWAFDAAITNNTDAIALGGGSLAGGAAIAMGTLATATGGYAAAMGYGSMASAAGALAMGYSAAASGKSSVSLGATSSASGDYAVAQGSGASASATNAMALGKNSAASQASSLAFGASANASAANAVALGSGSVADQANTVAVGSVGAERKIVNVGDGTLSASSKDAVNGSQLSATNQNVAQNSSDIANLDTRVTTVEGSVSDLANQINTGAVGLVQQDQTSGDLTIASNTGGSSVNFTGTAGPRELLGVAAGTTSNSAVNLGQLSPLVASLGGGAQVTADGSIVSPTYHMQGGTQTTVGDALDTLDTNLSSLETQINNGSIGMVMQDQTSRDLRIGATTDGQRLSVAGTTGNRVVTGVASGSVNVTSSDAVNGSQLYANAASTAAALGGGSTVNADGTVSAPSYSVGGTTVNNVGAAIGNIDGRVTQNTSDIASLQSTVGTMSGSVANAVSYDSAAHDQVTLGGSTSAPKVKLSNLQDGDLSATSTDAVTGAQLWNTNQQLSDLSQTVQNQQQTGTSAMSLDAGGAPAASATGSGAVAIGGGAQASGDNSVAIGSGSVADRANTVSVGSQGNERRITNVADGKAPTDAVNMRQFQSGINDVARSAYSGVAAATALTMIPEVDPGKTLAVGVAGATYKGYQAAAVGASARITQNLKVKVGAGISGSETTVGAGASYQW
ncbi:Head domain of trimeric autotransporter adhesin [Burkholderia sp. OK233]|nr:Head domain of trimeric autotransporter adhesin [Burkholderia sp. OK233]